MQVSSFCIWYLSIYSLQSPLVLAAVLEDEEGWQAAAADAADDGTDDDRGEDSTRKSANIFKL